MTRIDVHTARGKRQLLETMLTIREFELAVSDLYTDGALPGFVHLYIGEEAVAAGSAAPLDDGDQVQSTHRGHGHCLAMGMEPTRMFAELFGKETGYSHGKGGSMHMIDLDSGMMGTNGIVGSSIPLATGAALAAQESDDDRIALGYVGDGGTAQGQVHEAINLAATWDLPAIYVIENNQYAETAPVEAQHNVEDLSDLAEGYGIPGETVDGMDVHAVNDAVEDAAERARSGAGPSLIEAKTYRFHGHYEGDPQTYRTESEVEEWQHRDPIRLFKQQLLDSGVITEDDYDEMVESVRSSIASAVEEARSGPDPDPEAAFENMYTEPVPEIEHFRERLASDELTFGGL